MRTIVKLCICLGLLSCGSSGEIPRKGALDALFSRYWEDRMQLFPLEAMQAGEERYHDRLTITFTDAFRDSLRRFYTTYLNALGSYDRNSLDEGSTLDHDVFEWEMKLGLEALEHPTNLVPFHQFWGFPLDLGQLGSGRGSQPFRNMDDYRHWAQRAARFGPWADSAIVYFRKGLGTGMVLPRAVVLRMIPQMKALGRAADTANVFYGPLRHMPPAFSEKEKREAGALLSSVLKGVVFPAYDRLAVFLEKDYLPRSRATAGLLHVPGGEALYRYCIRYWTTMDLSPSVIYGMGLKEVARIRVEMERVRDSLGFRGDLPAFLQHLKTDARFRPYQKSEELLAAFEAIRQKVEPRLPALFGRKPRTSFEIRRTEGFREAAASAEYQQGSAEAGRPGVFYIPVPDARSFNITSGMESLFLHEALPGHHYQISLQQENAALPRFRKWAWYGAFGEGWALYCESLGRELGLYTDPYQYLGALGDEMHRALRLVIDVGLHARGMSREEAIALMMQHEAISEKAAAAEVDRYLAIPGQALSYKIGSMKLEQLRERAALRLGSRFRLPAFHDELLRDGAMPLGILDRKMKKWEGR